MHIEPIFKDKMATDTTKVGAGILLLLASAVLIFGTGTLDLTIRMAILGVAALGLAAGSLLVGTSDDGRPV
jgi:hypothetical protein